jgi:hypothetical protein
MFSFTQDEEEEEGEDNEDEEDEDDDEEVGASSRVYPRLSSN